MIEKDCLLCKYDCPPYECTLDQHPCCECDNYSHFEEYIGVNLYPMKQYPITRNRFCELFGSIDRSVFWEGYSRIEGEEFLLWRCGDEYYILHKPSGTLVNWYKHLGRCCTCNKDLNEAEWEKFVKLCIADLEESCDFEITEE